MGMDFLLKRLAAAGLGKMVVLVVEVMEQICQQV
jgi:hypothetical protein